MLPDLTRLWVRNYQALNRIEICRSALRSNYLYLSSLSKKIKIAPVLKSNAYGHGISLIAKELDSNHCPFFCTDSLYEAYELLKVKIKTPILVMGYFNPKSLQTKKLPFSYAVFSKDQVRAISKYQPQSKIHLFVDTGMHREGVLVKDLKSFLSLIRRETSLEIEGLMSHLGGADKPKSKETKGQIREFKKAQEITNSLGFSPRWIHTLNSCGLLNTKKMGDGLGNIARAGLALFGLDPAGKDKNLKPVLDLKTHISQIKQLKKGEGVGYDFSFKAKKRMKIASLPIGYYDGVDLRLSSLGVVKIGEKYCPIVGRVSMNITIIDVSRINNVKVGQEVVVYSKNKTDRNSIENSAKLVKTTSYNLLVHLASSTRRVLV